MKHEQGIVNRLMRDWELPSEAIPGQSLLELSGNNRCLIENHRGVIQYSNTQIGVKTGFGQIMVCGCGLELLHMSRERLVITGRIDSISLNRRENR